MIFNRGPKKQSNGSTLTISILMMALVFASVYAVSTISVRNSKQFFNTLIGGIGIVGADAAAEKGLWAHIRNRPASIGNCDTTPAQYQTEALQAPNDDFTISNCKTMLMPNPSVIDIAPNSTKEAYIIDPSNPSGPPNYSQATFTWAAGSGTIKVCDWGTANCSVGPHIGNYSQSAPGNTNTLALNPANRYQILYEAGPSGFSVSVSGKDQSNPAQDKGLPADLATIKGEGYNLFISRQLKVEVPQ